MTKIVLASATLVLTAALASDHDALAKGPLGLDTGIDAQQDLLMLVKETKYTDIDFKDFPFGLEEGRTEDVRLVFKQEIVVPEEDDSVSVNYAMVMPWIEVDKDGDDTVAVTFPEKQNVIVQFGPSDGESVEIDVDLTFEDMVMTFVRDGKRMTYSGGSKSFTFDMDTPEALAEEGTLTYRMGGKDLMIEGAGDAEQDYSDLQNLDLSYAYTIGSMNFAANIIAPEEEEMPPILVEGISGKVSATGKIGEGVLQGGGTMSDLVLNVKQPMPIELSFGKFRSDMLMSTEPSPKPQPFKYMVEAENIEIDETLWSMADPGKVFPRELNKLVIDMEMMAMLFVPFLDPAAMAKTEETGMPPMMPVGVTINSIALDALGLTVDAEGEGALEGATPKANAKLIIGGLEEFVANGVKAGMFGEQEAMMAAGMANQFGKPGQDGKLTFDIETKDGMVVVNGNPVAPLPGNQ